MKHYFVMYKGFIFHLLLDAYYFLIDKGMANSLLQMIEI